MRGCLALRREILARDLSPRKRNERRYDRIALGLGMDFGQLDALGAVEEQREYLRAAKEVGAAYRDIIGRHYPAMTAVQVAALIEDRARVEIEVTAIVPEA